MQSKQYLPISTTHALALLSPRVCTGSGHPGASFLSSDFLVVAPPWSSLPSVDLGCGAPKPPVHSQVDCGDGIILPIESVHKFITKQEDGKLF